MPSRSVRKEKSKVESSELPCAAARKVWTDLCKINSQKDNYTCYHNVVQNCSIHDSIPCDLQSLGVSSAPSAWRRV